MIPDGKERITITLGSKVVRMLDRYCEVMGQTRSTAVGAMVARQLVQDEDIVEAFRRGDLPEPDVLADMERQELVDAGLIGDDE